MAINPLKDPTKFGNVTETLNRSLGVAKKTVLPYAEPQNVDTSGNVLPATPKFNLGNLPTISAESLGSPAPQALTGMGTGSGKNMGVPVEKAPLPTPKPLTPTIKLDASMSQRMKPKPGGKTAVGLFKDEQEAHSAMLADGLSNDEAINLIAQRRKDIMGNGKITPLETYGLLKMQDDGLSSQEAVDMLKQMRQDKADARPLWKKIGENVLNVGVGAASLATEQTGNVLSAITAPFDESASKGFAQDVADVKDINQSANESLGGQIGRKAFGLGESLAATPSSMFSAAPTTGVLSTMGGRMAQGALVGGLQGATLPVLETGAEATAGDIASSAAMGAAGGAAIVPIAEKVIAPVLGKAVQYGGTAIKEGLPGVKAMASQDLQAVKQGFIKGMENVGKKVEAFDTAMMGSAPKVTVPVGEGETIGNKIAGWWSNKANRMIAGDVQKFEQMTGVKPGQWAIERGMTDVGDEAVVKATQLWKNSMEQADKGMEAIAGKFSTKGQADDVIGDLINANAEKATIRTRNADSPRSISLKGKYDAGEGLTMSEINEAKRIYARQHKYTWDQMASDAAVNSKDLQDAVRNWQMSTAEKNGLANLAEINKTTQGWKSYADMLGKSLSRKSANNAVSLTDWISLSGGKPENVALFLGKKLGEKYVGPMALKALTTPTKPAVVEAELGNIIKTNVAKDANFNLSSDLNTAGGGSLVRKAKPLQLNAPSGELPSGNVVNVKPQEGLAPGVLGKANKTISGQAGVRPSSIDEVSTKTFPISKAKTTKVSKKSPKSVSK